MKRISTWVARHNSRQNSLVIVITEVNGVPVQFAPAVEAASTKRSFRSTKQRKNGFIPDFTGGDEISGHVIAKIVKAIPRCQGVQFRFVGLEQTVVTEDDKFKYEETNVFEDSLIPLGGVDSQMATTTHLEPGTYQLDFEFVVPTGIPGSFFYSKGSKLRGAVSYYFEAYVNLGIGGPSTSRSAQSWLLSAEQPLELWGTLWGSGASSAAEGLSPAMSSRPPIEFHNEKQVGAGLFGGKRDRRQAVRISASIDRRMYFIGGPFADTDIVVSTKIENPTSKTVTQLRVELIRVVSLWAESHYESREIIIHRWSFDERLGNTNGAAITKRYRLECALIEDEQDVDPTQPLLVESILPMANGRARFRSPQQPSSADSTVVQLQQPEANVGRLIQCEYFIRVQLMLGKSKGPQVQIGDFVLTKNGPSSVAPPLTIPQQQQIDAEIPPAPQTAETLPGAADRASNSTQPDGNTPTVMQAEAANVLV